MRVLALSTLWLLCTNCILSIKFPTRQSQTVQVPCGLQRLRGLQWVLRSTQNGNSQIRCWRYDIQVFLQTRIYSAMAIAFELSRFTMAMQHIDRRRCSCSPDTDDWQPSVVENRIGTSGGIVTGDVSARCKEQKWFLLLKLFILVFESHFRIQLKSIDMPEMNHMLK